MFFRMFLGLRMLDFVWRMLLPCRLCVIGVEAVCVSPALLLPA